MTRRGRMLAAIAHGVVDRIPFATYNLHPYAGSIHVGDASYAPLLDLVAEKAGMLCKLSVSRMLLHESPRYIYPSGAPTLIEKAPVIDHSDAELRLLESLVHRKPPFDTNGSDGSDGY